MPQKHNKHSMISGKTTELSIFDERWKLMSDQVGCVMGEF